MKISTISAEKTSTAKTLPAKKKSPRRLALSSAKVLSALLFWLIIWQLAASYVNKELFLPVPALVAARAIELLPTWGFWHIIALSLARIALGFGLGVAAGFILAVLTHINRPADIIISPALKAMLATPMASFIILLLVWFTPGSVPVLVSFLVVLPVIWRNIRAGINAADQQLLEMARLFRLSRRRILRRLYLPSLMPHFLSACITAMGLAWKSGIAAEVISYPRLGIGSELQAGRVYLQTADVFVWTIAVIILSLLIERLLVGSLRRFYTAHED